MNDNQKEALRRSRVFLVQNIMINSIVDSLVSYNVFTEMMLEYITCKSPRSEQVRQLLGDLNRRPPEAYEAFIKCLNENGHEHCAKEIRKHMNDILRAKGMSVVTEETMEPTPGSEPAIGRAHLQSARPVQSIFPPTASSVQPSASAVGEGDVEMVPTDMSSVPRPVSLSSANASSISPQTLDYAFHKNRKPDDVYKMESSPRGCVYIINNIEFRHMAKREGSDVDETNLKQLFKSFGFEVYFDRNLTVEEMRGKLQAYAIFEKHSSVDSSIIVILSHGGDKRIYGVDSTGSGDGDFITDVDLRNWFGSTNCPLLQEKPKLFLIQACRGQDEHHGVTSMSSRTSSSSLSGSSSATGLSSGLPSGTGTGISEVNMDVFVEEGVNTSDCSLPLPSLPDQTDMINATSSVDGFVSYRSAMAGSIFISEVVNVFRDHAHDTHVNDLLTKVNNKVADFTTQHGKKMMPCPTNLLRKMWFLNPVPQIAMT